MIQLASTVKGLGLFRHQLIQGLKAGQRLLCRALIVSRMAKSDCVLTIDVSQIRRIFLEAQNSVFLAIYDDFDELEMELNINGIDTEEEE